MWALSKLIWRNFFQRVFEPFMTFIFPIISYLIIRFIIPFGDATDYTKANYIIPGIMLYIPMTLGLLALPVQIMQFKESVITKRIGVTPINKRKLTMVFVSNYILLGIIGAISFMIIVSLIELVVKNIGSSPQYIVEDDVNVDLSNIIQYKLENLLDTNNKFNKEEILELLNNYNLSKYLISGGLESNLSQEKLGQFIEGVISYSNQDSISLVDFSSNVDLLPDSVFISLGGKTAVTEVVHKIFSPYGGLFDIAKQQAILDINQTRGELNISGYLIDNEGIGYFILFFLLGNVMSIFCGLMLTSISKSLPVAQALGSFVFFPSMFLTGMFFPIPFQGGAGDVAWIAPWRSISVLMFMSWFGSGSVFSNLSGHLVNGVTSGFFGLDPNELPLGETYYTWLAIGIAGGFSLFCLIFSLWKFNWTRIKS